MYRRVLHWSYSNIYDIPIDLFLYENLEEIYLKENFISHIPRWFLNMNTLKFIHLTGNNLTELPEEINLLENLHFLDVSHNKLSTIPATLCQLENLEYLNVSSNQLTELPNDINRLKRLQFFDASGNDLKRLPIQLSECLNLQRLNVSDNNNLWHIPERIAYMKSLTMLSAERCSLAYLPVCLPKFIAYLRIFDNGAIGHIPMTYERFYDNYFGNRNKKPNIVITNKNLFWVVEMETQTKLLLPIGTRKIFPVPSKDNQVPLYDHCLKALEKLNRSTPIYLDNRFRNIIPETYMMSHMKNGPLGCCTLHQCLNPIFTSYYFMVVKRADARQLFTCYFCTVFCAKKWLQENSCKYYKVDWEIWREDTNRDDDD